MTPIVTVNSSGGRRLKRRSVSVGGGGGGGGEVELDVVIQRFDGGSGTMRVSCAIPLPPTGPYAMTAADIAARKGTLLIAGSEYACLLVATKARHQNEAVMSAIIQLDIALNTGSPISAKFRPQQTRTLSDPSFTTVTGTMAAGNAGVLPTDPAYLCSTECTLQPMIPASQFTAEETAWFITWFANVQTQMDLAWTNDEGTGATYQVGRAFLSHWCVTGNVQSWNKGMRIIERWQRRYLASPPSTGETTTMATFDHGIGYILSGYETYFVGVGKWAHLYGGVGSPCGLIYSSQINASYPGYNSGSGMAGVVASGGHRQNMVPMFPLLAAHRIDAKRTNGTFTTYLSNGAGVVFATQMGYRINALIANQWNGTGYRDGMTGLLTSFRLNGVDEFPTFWLSIVNACYRDYYHNVHGDTRIPALIKANFDIMLSQVKSIPVAFPNYAGGSRHGIPYLMNDTVTPTTDPNDVDSVLFCMFQADAAFLSRFYPSDVVQGATYLEWYNRMIIPANVDILNNLAYNRWKNFGEALGWNYSAPFHRSGTSYTPPAVIREPIVNNT